MPYGRARERGAREGESDSVVEQHSLPPSLAWFLVGWKVIEAGRTEGYITQKAVRPILDTHYGVRQVNPVSSLSPCRASPSGRLSHSASLSPWGLF